MKGTFDRIAPAVFAEKTGIPLGWMVISHRWMPDKSDRRRAHGKWFRLKSAHGTSYRVLRFSPNLEVSPKESRGGLVLDWPAWLELNGYADDVSGPIELEITKASLWLPQLAASHPDPAMRLSSMLGLVSVILGILSIILAVALT
jgi:hypothetical protein